MVRRRARGRWLGWLFLLRRPLRRLAAEAAAGAARVVVEAAVAAPQAPVVAELRPAVAEAEAAPAEEDVAAAQALVRLAVEAEAARVAAPQQRRPRRSPW
jgi:hypothetical protein